MVSGEVLDILRLELNLQIVLSAWVNRGKARVRTKIEEDDIATKIQAGYKGLVAREEFKDLRKPK